MIHYLYISSNDHSSKLINIYHIRGTSVYFSCHKDFQDILENHFKLSWKPIRSPVDRNWTLKIFLIFQTWFWSRLWLLSLSLVLGFLYFLAISLPGGFVLIYSLAFFACLSTVSKFFELFLFSSFRAHIIIGITDFIFLFYFIFAHFFIF